MSGKNMKLLRQGAKKYKLPYKILKRAFLHINSEDKGKFLKEARMIKYLP